MPTTQLYVFAPLLDAPRTQDGRLTSQPVVCGRIDLDAGTGSFRYAPGWLQAPLSYPWDPTHLPLIETPTYHQVNRGGGGGQAF